MNIDILRADQASPGRQDYRLAQDVVLLFVADHTARILDFGGLFCSVSQSAARMLYETLNHGMESAIETIAATYRIDRSRIQVDLQNLLADLESKGLILGPQSRKQPSPPKIRRMALRVMLSGAHSLPLSLNSQILVLFGLIFAAIRMLGWPETVRLFQSQHQKPPQVLTDERKDLPQEVDTAIRDMAAGYPFPVECKERALCCWTLLRGVGLPAQLVVGISLFPLESHCWCELEGCVLTDHLDRCERFTPVMRYD